MPPEIQTQLQLLGEVALAMLLSAVVGIERQLAHRPAGLRTHMLMGGAAALVVGLAFSVVRSYAADPAFPLLKIDPTVVIQGVISAAGFLGVASILRPDADHVQGATTAASLVFVTAIGVATGLHQFLLAAGATVFAYVTLHIIHKFEDRIANR
jgi:putative Mg2+ transporter-C (MgtC) family protein